MALPVRQIADYVADLAEYQRLAAAVENTMWPSSSLEEPPTRAWLAQRMLMMLCLMMADVLASKAPAKRESAKK